MSSFLSPEQQAMFDRALLAAGKLTSPTSSYNNLAAEADSQSGSKRRHHHHHNHHHRSHRSSSKDETAASALTKKSPLKAVLKCGKGAWVLTDDGSMDAAEDDDGMDIYDDNDVEDDRNVVYTSTSSDDVSNGKTVITSESELRTNIADLIREYFLSGDAAACLDGFSDIDPARKHGALFCRRLIALAIDRRDREREMASRLLARAVDVPPSNQTPVLSEQACTRGILSLLEQMSELVIDSPDAVEQLSLFAARAVMDGCVAPNFFEQAEEVAACHGGAAASEEPPSARVVRKASVLCADKHAAERIVRCWGAAAGRTFAEIKLAVTSLIDEYVQSGDADEARRCLRELDVPFCHHELTKQMLRAVVEARGGDKAKSLVRLLRALVESNEVSSSQFARGLHRFVLALDDLALDVPWAKGELKEFLIRERAWFPLEVEIAAEEGIDGMSNHHIENGENGVMENGNSASYAVPPEATGAARREETSAAAEKGSVKAAKQRSNDILLEYMTSLDVDEAIRRVAEELADEPNLPAWHAHALFVKKAVSVALDHRDCDREAVSKLLWHLGDAKASKLEGGPVVQHASFKLGFASLVSAAHDLRIDHPLEGLHAISLFLARAVVDELLVPMDLVEYVEALEHGELDSPSARSAASCSLEVVRCAKRLLSARHAAERLYRCWGAAAGRTFAEIKLAVTSLIDEYVQSGDADEARRCLRELDVPFCHHELTKQMLRAVVEARGDDKAKSLVRLLRALVESNEASSSQFARGLHRFVLALDDLALDVPWAKGELKEFLIRERAWFPLEVKDALRELESAAENAPAGGAEPSVLGSTLVECLQA
ncbi:MA3 domain-containing translation regulatory factor [Pseudoscourfieldia marina]